MNSSKKAVVGAAAILAIALGVFFQSRARGVAGALALEKAKVERLGQATWEAEQRNRRMELAIRELEDKAGRDRAAAPERVVLTDLRPNVFWAKARFGEFIKNRGLPEAALGALVDAVIDGPTPGGAGARAIQNERAAAQVTQASNPALYAQFQLRIAEASLWDESRVVAAIGADNYAAFAEFFRTAGFEAAVTRQIQPLLEKSGLALSPEQLGEFARILSEGSDRAVFPLRLTTSTSNVAQLFTISQAMVERAKEFLSPVQYDDLKALARTYDAIVALESMTSRSGSVTLDIRNTAAAAAAARGVMAGVAEFNNSMLTVAQTGSMAAIARGATAPEIDTAARAAVEDALARGLVRAELGPVLPR